MSAQSWRKFLHNMCGGILVIFSYSLYNKINFPLFSAKGTIVIFFFCTLLLSPLPQGRELKYVLPLLFIIVVESRPSRRGVN